MENSSRAGEKEAPRPAISTNRTTSSSAARKTASIVADRQNQRIQVFDQDGNFIVAWKQFGAPSSVFVGKDDTIYVGSGFPDPAAKRGEVRGIVVGNALDGSLNAFIPDLADPDSLTRGTTSSGVAADDEGSVYFADVAAHNLRKYVKVK